MMTLSLSLAALLATPVDLGPVLVFSAPAACETAEPLSTIIDAMAVLDPRTFEAQPPPPIAVPGFAERIVPRFTRTRTVYGNADIREVSIMLDIPGRWHGLRVTRLLRHFVEEGDSSSVEIQFAERPQRVRAVLRRAGFRLGPIGSWRDIEGSDELGTSVGISRIEGGAALACATG